MYLAFKEPDSSKSTDSSSSHPPATLFKTQRARNRMHGCTVNITSWQDSAASSLVNYSCTCARQRGRFEEKINEDIYCYFSDLMVSKKPVDACRTAWTDWRIDCKFTVVEDLRAVGRLDMWWNWKGAGSAAPPYLLIKVIEWSNLCLNVLWCRMWRKTYSWWSAFPTVDDKTGGALGKEVIGMKGREVEPASNFAMGGIRLRDIQTTGPATGEEPWRAPRGVVNSLTEVALG